jgi:hypothetical protein
MNQIERVVDAELGLLLDRLAASVPGGCLGAISAERPGLRGRLDEVEARLASARGALLEGYGRWRRALDDLENLWAVAAWRAAAEQPAEEPPSLAA